MPPDPQRCPLCGESNECGVARGFSTCWCFNKPIPDDVLKRIPREARQFACACEPCASGKRNPPEALVRIRQILGNSR
jgi:hypothetical protein